MRRAVVGYYTGFTSPSRGLALALRHPRLMKLMIIPFLLTVLVMGVAFVWGFGTLVTMLPMIAAEITLWSQLNSFIADFVYWMILLCAWPAALFAVVYFSWLLARVIAAPFYGYLAERTLIETGVIADQPFRFSEWLSLSVRLVGISLLKLLVFMVVGVILFALSFIPGVGIFTAFGFLLMAAFDVVDLSFEALRMGFRERITVFRSEFPAFLGLASVLGLVFLIPGLNFILLPATIAGASEILRASKTH